MEQHEKEFIERFEQKVQSSGIEHTTVIGEIGTAGSGYIVTFRDGSAMMLPWILEKELSSQAQNALRLVLPFSKKVVC